MQCPPAERRQKEGDEFGGRLSRETLGRIQPELYSRTGGAVFRGPEIFRKVGYICLISGSALMAIAALFGVDSLWAPAVILAICMLIAWFISAP